MRANLSYIDYIIILFIPIFSLVVGIICSKTSGKNKDSFFLGNRAMPWWLLGLSMVATTFSTDTPNLVTDIVRKHGTFGNWSWWCFLPTSLLTVFLYAKLWRRMGVLTDLEFYELRYSGKIAAFLRGFRSIYLGFFYNVLIIALVSLAAIKIGAAILGIPPIQCIVFVMTITAIFVSLGGLKSVLITDFVLFFIAMTGSIAAAYFSLQLPEINGLNGLIQHFSGNYQTAKMLSPMTPLSFEDLIAFFIIPLSITWWSAWYPGAEPGGGTYMTQRILASKNEKHATFATLFFNIAHYAIRPWPWIIVALCSIIIYPDIASIKDAVGGILPDIQCQDDVAYSLMLNKIPNGWIGLVLASLLSAYISTVSTQLNLGASYLVNDLWKRFVNPKANEKELIWCARGATVVLMIFGGLFALKLQNALQAFQLILSIGAGTGLIFLLRWFWWRINASCEIVAMISSFTYAIIFVFWKDCPYNTWQQMLISVVLTTLTWLPFVFFGPKTDDKTLRNFCKIINPGGWWQKVYNDAEKDGNPIITDKIKPNIPLGILCTILACFAILCILFSIGNILYGKYIIAIFELLIASIFFILIFKSNVFDN